MRKYSLVVEDTISHTRKIIAVFDLEMKEFKKKVHIKDIDYMTCSYKDKYELLEDLYSESIIDFYFGNTYIVTTYNQKDFYYQTIYNQSDMADVAMNVDHGFIVNKESKTYQNIVQQFGQLFQDSNFENKIRQTYYINNTLKNLILRYLCTMNSFMYQEEQLNEQKYLWQSILKEISRYKTYRGIVLFINSYCDEYIGKYIPKKQYKIRESSNPFGNSVVKEAIAYREQLKHRVDAYNQEYDEYLDPQEYEEAYGENKQYCK